MKTAFPLNDSTMLQWLFGTTYGRIYLSAHLHNWQLRRTYVPLKRSVAVNSEARDPTEHDALKLWLTGVIPNRNYNGIYAVLPHRRMKARSLTRWDEQQMQRWLQSPQRLHPECVGLSCNACKQKKPVGDFRPDPRNTGRQGKYSTCRTCEATGKRLARLGTHDLSRKGLTIVPVISHARDIRPHTRASSFVEQEWQVSPANKRLLSMLISTP